MTHSSHKQLKGINAALSSAIFLGLTPVFGKLAIHFGMPPMAVVCLRTTLACVLLLLVVLIYKRSYLYIYPAGLLGCLFAGGINGLGSLLFYSALGRINASIAQVIYSIYPLFVAMWLWFDHQPPSRLTAWRLLLVLPALYLLLGNQQIDRVGVLMMLIAAALYALHLPINQRVLYDMPAPTVTLYTLLAMSAVVLPAFIFTDFIHTFSTLTAINTQSWGALLGLTLVTFFSRLTLFMGVKHLGGLQTALLGLTELLITIIFSHLWLNERLSIYQWGGVALLMVALVMVKFEKPVYKKHTPGGWLSWVRPPSIPPEFPWQSPDKIVHSKE